jgi:peptidylprolyl isomerase
MKSNILMAISIMAVISMVFLAGCSGPVEKTVKAGDKVSVDYTGTFTNGTVFDTSIEKIAKESGVYNSERDYKPLEFLAGAGQMIKGFDDAVIGMKIGESKNISIPPSEAYGEKLLQMPIKKLTDMGIKPEVDQTLYSQYGQPLYKIVSIDEASGNLTVESLNPMAGQTLQFNIVLKSIESK